MRNALLVALVGLTTTACGGVDNVAACEALAEDLSCGDYDAGAGLGCDAYADIACDYADYFNCLSDNFECTDDVVDVTGWADCADLASCD